MLHKITKSKSQVLAFYETVKVKRRESGFVLWVFFVRFLLVLFRFLFLKTKLLTKPLTPVPGENARPSLHSSCYL